MFDTQIKKKVVVKEFINIIQKYKAQQIECTKHTFFRLNEKQREIFTCEELTKILLKETPFLVGLQQNDNYAIFYKHQDKNLKMIVGINTQKVNIVTFYFIQEWQIPKI